MSRQTRNAELQIRRTNEILVMLTHETLEDLARKARHAVIPDGYPTSTGRDGMPRGKSEYTGCEAAADLRGFAGTGSPEHNGVPSTMVGRVPPDPTGDAIRQLFEALHEARNAALFLREPLSASVRPVVAAEADLAAVRLFMAGCTDDRVRQAPAGDPIFGQLAGVAAAVGRAGVKLTYINHVRHAAEGRQSALAGPCQACGRDVAGTELDRLRSGYCDACRKAWDRTAPQFADGTRGLRQDRNRFERERRQQLAVLDEKESA